MSIESGKFDMWPGRDDESLEGSIEQSAEREGVDLRHESEVFADHERLGGAEDEAWLALARDTLAEDVDGVLHIDIPAYRYDTNRNPFISTPARATKVFQIARVIDVVLLHRLMYHDILVVGLCSMDYAQSHSRAGFIKRVRESGGGPILPDQNSGYDIEAMRFMPYTASHSVASWLDRYHRQAPSRDERPHHPIDLWLIYDEQSYERVSGDDERGRYRLKPGYDRKSSLLAVAQIN